MVVINSTMKYILLFAFLFGVAQANLGTFKDGKFIYPKTNKPYTGNLDVINKHNNTGFIMTYSYGRALQQNALKFWSKDINNIRGTQDTFNHRANMCSLAAQGKWSEEFESK